MPHIPPPYLDIKQWKSCESQTHVISHSSLRIIERLAEPKHKRKMRPIFEHNSPSIEASDAWSDKNEVPPGNEHSSPSDTEKAPRNLSATDDQVPFDSEITYPEGGRDAWLVVLGAWCGLTSSLGIYNTTGVFEVVISRVLLPDASSSSLGWIFSVYAFVNWVCGVQVGPTFDAMGPRVLILAGSICTLVGIFTLSVSTGKIESHNIQPRVYIHSRGPRLRLRLPDSARCSFALLTAVQNTIRSFCLSLY